MDFESSVNLNLDLFFEKIDFDLENYDGWTDFKSSVLYWYKSDEYDIVKVDAIQ